MHDQNLGDVCHHVCVYWRRKCRGLVNSISDYKQIARLTNDINTPEPVQL